MSRTVPPPGSLFAGIARLAFFNRSGFAAIGNTPQAFLSSLSPLVAFLLVFAAMESLAGNWRFGATNALQVLCFLVAQPVVSHLLAHWWKRDRQWLRYATAINWCQLAIPFVGFTFMLVAIFAGGSGPSPRALAYGLVGMVGLYGILLNGFLAWRGLDLTLWRAALLVLIVNIGIPLVLGGLSAGARVALHQPPSEPDRMI